MKLAFVLFTYFPLGGLTKDLAAIARLCRRRGHQVKIFTESCRGEAPNDLEMEIHPVQGISNHTKNRRFAEQLPVMLGPFKPDLVVGFHKMPGLDMYYAADGCFAEKSQQRGIFTRLTSRNRHFEAYERAVFSADMQTDILMIAERQIAIYQHIYATPDARFHLLPPGISRDRIAPVDPLPKIDAFRRRWQLGNDEKLVLMVGSGFRTKGLDRAIDALAALPEVLQQKTRLMVIGHDNSKPFAEQARQRGVADRVVFLSGRDDVPVFLLGADLLIHPAYRENTGTVLLEAMVAGLPVLTTDVCGYAHYVSDYQMGLVIGSPIDQRALNVGLAQLLFEEERGQWRKRGRHFAEVADIYDMPLYAVKCIEQAFEKRRKHKNKHANYKASAQV